MALSLIEFGFLALLGYGTIAMLLTTLVRESPSGRSWASMRAVLLVPGMLALWALATPGPVLEYDRDGRAVGLAPDTEPLHAIVLSEGVRTEVVATGGAANGSVTEPLVATNVTVVDREVLYLHYPAWSAWHWLLGVLMMVFIFVAVMQLLTRPAKGD